MISEEKKGSEKWINSTVELIEAYRELVSIRIAEHTSLGISVAVIGLLSLIMAVFVLMFTGLGAAWWLGEYMANMKAGFFIVGGVYTLIFGSLLALAPKVLVPRIRDLIIKKMYEQD